VNVNLGRRARVKRFEVELDATDQVGMRDQRESSLLAPTAWTIVSGNSVVLQSLAEIALFDATATASPRDGSSAEVVDSVCPRTTPSFHAIVTCSLRYTS
jgi:hypothetical protein